DDVAVNVASANTGGGTINTGIIDVGTTDTAQPTTLTLDHGTALTGTGYSYNGYHSPYAGTLSFGGASDTLVIGAGGATLDEMAVAGGGAIDIGSGNSVTGVTLTLDAPLLLMNPIT